MSNLNEEPNESSLVQSREKTLSDKLSLFEQFGAAAYGVILQIIPNEKQAQEVLVSLFSGSILEECKKCAASKIACIVRCARIVSLEFKKHPNTNPKVEDKNNSKSNTNLSNTIFNLSFKEGVPLETIAQKLSITKEASLKYIKEYFNYFR